jgi:hypothetical protein
MKLRSISFKENIGSEHYWNLSNFEISNVNLIVAKNATGKSRTLNVISHLASLISGKAKVEQHHNYTYSLHFDDNDTIFELEVLNGTVKKELLIVNGKSKIIKENGSHTNVHYESINQNIDSLLAHNVIASSQRDSAQKKYLDPLIEWSENTVHMRFGTQIGQQTYSAHTKEFETNFDYTNTSAVAPYLKMSELNGTIELLNKAILDDLNAIGYSISEIGYCDAGFIAGNNDPLQKIYVKERDLESNTSQEIMSQGMFRAIAVLVQVNYIKITNVSCSLLIDDIGEGLDYQRSLELIKILCNKFSGKHSKQQLIMTTNDRQVMNEIPLEYWSILVRKGHNCSAINKKNSPEIFEDFEFTGLNNFDFFSSEFYKG